MGKLDGKVVLLTGASRGLGKQAAIRMAEEGANLSICARNMEKLNETKKLCEKAGADVIAIQCDVTSPEALENLVNKTIEHFGTINVLVNNAAYALIGEAFINQTIENHLEKTIQGCLYSTWRLMQLCYPYMKAAGGGSIINLGSGASQTGLADFASYAAVKGAITALTKVVATEWGIDNIRANLIHPAGYTDTIAAGMSNIPKELADTFFDITRQQLSNNPLHRMGDPYSDIAPVFVFLASDDSIFITGQTIRVEGGMLLI